MIGEIPSIHSRVDRHLIQRRSVVSRIRVVVVCTVVLSSIMTLSACSPASPEEQIAQLRSRYEARVNGFYVTAEPLVVEAMVEPEASEEETAGEDAVEGEDVEEPEMVVSQNAHLDLIVQHDADEMLPGITVEISMVDSAQQEKGRWQLWVDTSGLRKANQLQLTHVLEDVPYVEGDGFAAEVRVPVPAAERGNYREFDSPSQ
jgi:hypothetical protein